MYITQELRLHVRGRSSDELGEEFGDTDLVLNTRCRCITGCMNPNNSTLRHIAPTPSDNTDRSSQKEPDDWQ